ncbi:hypothetical protein T492DRAFT_834046 [Pavlovales sp. CCMP2436]|nr:hypothetical protein T492DRAFT_834046 [Pavlovales sp. CCMP2436]
MSTPLARCQVWSPSVLEPAWPYAAGRDRPSCLTVRAPAARKIHLRTSSWYAVAEQRYLATRLGGEILRRAAIIRSLLEADGRYAARYIGEKGDAPGPAREGSSATPMALPVDELGTQVQASGSTYRIAELDGAPLTSREREVYAKLYRFEMQ